MNIFKKINKVYNELFFESLDIKTNNKTEKPVLTFVFEDLKDTTEAIEEIYSSLESLENKIQLLTEEILWKVDKKGKHKSKKK